MHSTIKSINFTMQMKREVNCSSGDNLHHLLKEFHFREWKIDGTSVPFFLCYYFRSFAFAKAKQPAIYGNI